MLRYAWNLVLCAALALALTPMLASAESEPASYQQVTQADLAGNPEGYQGKKVQFTGTFLFTGSDFCYQIRKTKINTRDYFCFALGTPSLVRLYLKKDHPQSDALMQIKKGQKIQAFGTFDFVGGNYNFMVVDEFAVVPAG